VLKLLTCPLILLTLGLFTLVINGLMLWLTAWVAGRLGLAFTVAGFVPALLGAIVISIVSVILSWLVQREE
jgi:putative membrane protein